MTATDLVAGARALIKPLTGHTPGEWEMSVTHPTNACANVWCGYTDVATLYGGDSDVPQPADDEPWGPQPIRDANARLTAAAPALRDTVAALADLADAQAQLPVLEAQLARTLGLNVTTFCAVQRPENHPARPASYRPLHAFWRSRGYTERPDLTTEMHWQDVGQSVETPHEMRFWVK